MPRFFIILGTVLLISGSVTSTGQAQTGEVIELRPGFTRLLQFDRAVRTVAIGNPDVADAAVQSDRAALLTAKRVGETNLIAIDPGGVELFRATVLVGGGETGRMVFHTKKQIHEYWTYRCTVSGCQRVEDKFEFREAAPSIIVAPRAEPAVPAR
jgi:Flp pilus assembly secretin CpaC